MAKRPNPATKAAPAAKATPAPEARGRGPNSENQERLAHILARTKQEPGVTSPTLARELDITTLQCSQLTDRLVRSGELEIFKLATGVRTNYLPKDLAKVRARLEKQRDADIAAREANVDTDKAEKFRKLKENAAAKKAAAAAPATPAPKARKGTSAPAPVAAPARKGRKATAQATA